MGISADKETYSSVYLVHAYYPGTLELSHCAFQVRSAWAAQWNLVFLVSFVFCFVGLFVFSHHQFPFLIHKTILPALSCIAQQR